MATQEAKHSLESIVRGHHVYKYTLTPCLEINKSENLNLNTLYTKVINLTVHTQHTLTKNFRSHLLNLETVTQHWK